MMAVLTPRWRPLRFHPEQRRLWTSPARFKTVPAGRRSGKTELGKRKVVLEALRGPRGDFPDARYFCAGPTRDQAKRIFWDDLKQLVPAELMYQKASESELMIRLMTGAEIWVVGLDKPERIEGTPWDGGVVTEIANVKQRAWTHHIRPALSDRQGWCWLEGVPEGRNHYYFMHKEALAQAAACRDIPGTRPEWDGFHWVSADILPPEEVEAARRDLDPLSFQQEYEASFVNFSGRAYYPFLDSIHCAALFQHYNPKQPLILCFDFNVAPGVAAIVQELPLPSGEEGTAVIGEVFIPRNSNTRAVCRKIAQEWRHHQGLVLVHGDATGGAKRSSAPEGSDWDLVEDELTPVFGARLRMEYPLSNPSERSRVNAVNTRLRSASGQVRLMVDPQKAPRTVVDFEGVVLLEGGSGEIDKVRTPDLTHLSDAVGYYIAETHPITGRVSYDQAV